MKGIYTGLYFAAVVSFFFASAVSAQLPADPSSGPVPPGLLAAKTVFVSNAGSDSGLFPSPFSGSPARPYAEFCAALKATGDYTLVTDPGQADLVLELQLTAPYGPSDANKVAGAADPLPMFRLVVYDRKSHYVLWTITESIEAVVGQKAHDKTFDEALNAVLADFLLVAGKAPPAAH
ncbi:MAG: hypothetical protein ACLQG3_01790 [Terracidiphilus sp.]